jgi:hypothetical protein
MNRASLTFTLAFAAAMLVSPAALIAQSYSPVASYSSAASWSSSASLVAPEADPGSAEGQTYSPVQSPGEGYERPLSRLAFGAGISPLGIQLQTATNLASHFGLRATGNFFNYSTSFTSNGINADASLNLRSVGASVDVYPFHSGFRLSPGVLFNNQNQVTATTNVPAGTSFTLNGATYYSANANVVTGATPVAGNAVLGLNATKPAFTITAGWGNIARGRGHWSFPTDIGVALIGAPTVNVSLTGWACQDQAQTMCTNIADPANPIAQAVQSNLTAQVSKWTSDLNPLKTYPILSTGVAYSFHIR